MGTSDPPGALRRYLGSRKNMVGMAGALAGVGMHAAGVIGEVWPVVAIGLYGVGALGAPSDPAGEPCRLTDVLRAEATVLLERAEARRSCLPSGTVADVGRITRTVRHVLDRLDEVADQQADRIAAPERLAHAAEIVRVDLPACLDGYLGRPASTAEEPARGELAAQLELVAGRADRLAAQVPDVHLSRAEELTREMRRRHEE